MLECRFNKTTHHPACRVAGRVRWRACGAGRARVPNAASMRRRGARVFGAAGARALGAGAGFWPACACLHSRGGRRGSAQAAERIARAGTGRLGGLYVAARRGPALDLVCMRTTAHGFLCWCAGCRLLQGIGKRAQAPTCDRNQACSPSCDRAVFISLKCPPRSLGSVPFSRCRTSSRCRTCLPLAPLPISALLPC